MSSVALTCLIFILALGITCADYGDGGSATAATLEKPTFVALDLQGNLYVADYYHNVIRKVTASNGIIDTIAGAYCCYEYNGDNKAATSTHLDPKHITLDNSGNLYIGDTINNRVRKFTVSTGTITTIAGTGATSYDGNGGAATSATLYDPEGLALDASDNVYITDYGNYRIRKVTKSTGIISSVAGSRNACSSSIGDGDQATSASLCYPNGVALSSSGNIYISDTNNFRIRKVDASNGIISTVAGGSSSYNDNVAATSTKLKPWTVTLDSSDNIYIADIGAHLIRKVISSSGLIITIAGIYDNKGYSGDYMAATSSALNKPSSIALDANGNLYIADRENNLVRFVSVTTGIMSNAVGIYYEDDTNDDDDDSSTNNGDDDDNNGDDDDNNGDDAKDDYYDDDSVSGTESLVLGLIFGLFLPLTLIYCCYHKFCTKNSTTIASTTIAPTTIPVARAIETVAAVRENSSARKTSVSTTTYGNPKSATYSCTQSINQEYVSVKNYHCFLSHNWGNAPDYENHRNVRRINQALRGRGMVTWFDDDEMHGCAQQRMTEGIDNSQVILLFITKTYRDKVNQEDTRDNCKFEFGYAHRSKHSKKLIPVVMESSMRSTRDWSGVLGATVGGNLYVDFSDVTSSDMFQERIDRLLNLIDNASS